MFVIGGLEALIPKTAPCEHCDDEIEEGEILINLLHISDCCGVLLRCAVRNNDPWPCEPLVSKWLGWSPRIPDACCHRDKYATSWACHSPPLPLELPFGLCSEVLNCCCCLFKD